MNKPLRKPRPTAVRQKVGDLKVFGDGDTFKLIGRASSKSGGWQTSTKAMQIDGVGCVVQVTTQQGANVSEALTFVPNVKLEPIDRDKDSGWRLVKI